MSNSHDAPSDRTRVRRVPKRAVYDSSAIYAILDEALICHVGLVDAEQPFVIPTIHLRVADELFIHGSAASRLILQGKSEAALCVTVTLVDGVVLARSAFHHSMNYRSVVILGRARLVRDLHEKLAVFSRLVDRFSPGRSASVRPPNELELKATSLLSLPIAEASAKVRTGGPVDDEEDLQLPVWAGVIPVRLAAGQAQVEEPSVFGKAAPTLGFPLAEARSVERG